MYSYDYDYESGGIVLNSSPLEFSKEPRPVYSEELNLLGFDKYWDYPNDNNVPIMWAETNNYIYRGKKVGQTKGGSIYTKPEIIILDEPEPNNGRLKIVDVSLMIKKNNEILTGLAQETIKNIYNTFMEYKRKVDVFYVAFSGGKDSIVALDLVQRALNHADFKVVFGDTGMENADTYHTVEKVKDYCQENNISFYVARSHLSPKQTWEAFGPPAVGMRWCCGVHKTSPQIELLRNITGLKEFTGMAFTGVRGDESATRSSYDDVSFGTKHHGQYSCHPILRWNSAELYLYIFQQKLLLNPSYKKGNSRVGCLVCPMSTGKHEYIKSQCYSEGVNRLVSIIKDTSIKKEFSSAEMNDFINQGYWRLRKSGKELVLGKDKHIVEVHNGIPRIYVKKVNDRWKEWAKTIGTLVERNQEEYNIEFMEKLYVINFSQFESMTLITFTNCNGSKNDIKFMSLFKSIIIKSLYCINCGYCVAECPYGCIDMSDGIKISENCRHCHKCHDIYEHCIRYNSIRNKIGEGSMENNKNVKQMGRYLSFGIKGEWMDIYCKYKGSNEFWECDGDSNVVNKKKEAFLKFLRDANIVVQDKDAGYDVYTKNRLTILGEKIIEWGIYNDNSWALMVCNLVYHPDFNWYVKKMPFNTEITQDQLMMMLENASSSNAVRKNVKDSFKFILITTPVGNKLGLGECEYEEKYDRNNQLKLNLKSIVRKTWDNPNPLVILYSLFLYAEHCGGFHKFNLTKIMESNEESDGLTPSQIFGLDKESMKKILNGLSVNYPEFIKTSFVLDLESITLNEQKNAEDVLALF